MNMSNLYNDIISDNIIDEVDKMHFVREEDAQDYMKKWYQAVMDNDEITNINQVKPPVGHIISMTRDQLLHEEEKFINSFSE